jgi:RimJ/RimL family protein N-acetyltransferase
MKEVINSTLFTGDLVRLAAIDAQTVAAALSSWGRNSEYWRLQAGDPARLFSVKPTKDWIEKFLDKENPDVLSFTIRRLEDDLLIGVCDLDGLDWPDGDAFISIGIGEPEFWSKGYGTDAMKVLLRYAFSELNLRRVTLTVFAYNPRAVRSYVKAGFVEEGRMRNYIHRDGQRYDLIFMGLLREDWQRLQEAD